MAYFALIGPLVVYGLVVADALGAQFSGMSPVGSTRGRDPNLMWAVGVYCGFGVVAAGITERWTRLFLTLAAHLMVIFAEAQTPSYCGGGVKSGLILCAELAVPFGLAWFTLIADTLFKRRGSAAS